MPRRNRPIAGQQPLAVSTAYAGGLWLAAWALAGSVRLMVAGSQWRRFGLPQHGWIPGLALLPALAWCVAGSALMALPVARLTQEVQKGNP